MAGLSAATLAAPLHRRQQASERAKSGSEAAPHDTISLLPSRCATRGLSQWDCPELVRKLKADGVVQTISPETVGRILRSHKLKPWRHHLWLSAKVPRDDHFAKLVHTLVDLYTRPLDEEEIVLCVDEKTNLQLRSRLAATLPTRPGIPTRLEHGYKRGGALHLFAAFDTRTGKVYARTEMRKRQVEFLAFLSQLERELPVAKTRVFLVMDNLESA